MGVKLDIRGVKIGEANFRASLQKEKGRGGVGLGVLVRLGEILQGRRGRQLDSLMTGQVA